MKTFFKRIGELLHVPHVLRFWIQISPLDIVREEKGNTRKAWMFILIGTPIGWLLFWLWPTIWPPVILYFVLSLIYLGENWSENWHKYWMTWQLGPALFPAFVWTACLMFFPWFAGLLA